MTFDIDAWAKSPAGRQFHYFHPYLTYSDPDNTNFIGSNGKPIKEVLTSDLEALFRLGREAFKRLTGESSYTREEFDDAYAKTYWRNVDDFREFLTKLVDEGYFRIISETTGQPILLDIKEADQDQIVSLSWQLYSRTPWFEGEAHEEAKAEFFGLFLFHVFWEIDNALIGLALGGEAVVAAINATNALSNAIAIETGDEKLTEVRKQLAYQAAVEKLRRDPKQQEKAFVHQCWEDWQKKPDSYKSKAAFARDMLDKCVYLTSQKIIEDWCRKWEKSEPC